MTLVQDGEPTPSEIVIGAGRNFIFEEEALVLLEVIFEIMFVIVVSLLFIRLSEVEVFVEAI